MSELYYNIVQFLYYVQLIQRYLIRIDIKCSSKDIAEVSDASLSVLPSWTVDGNDGFNITNYENGAAVRPIDRICIVQNHNVTYTSNIVCEWDLERYNWRKGWREKCNKLLTSTVNWSIGEAAVTVGWRRARRIGGSCPLLLTGTSM